MNRLETSHQLISLKLCEIEASNTTQEVDALFKEKEDLKDKSGETVPHLIGTLNIHLSLFV